jgi:hypothetical protein
MAHKAEAYPAQLSGGEKQRVSIAPTQHYHKFSNFLTNCNAETPSPFVVAAGELLF